MTTKCPSCGGSGKRIETYTDTVAAQDDPNFGFPKVRVVTKTRFVDCGNCKGLGVVK